MTCLKKVGGEVMSDIITSRVIEKVVKELLEVLKRHRERYMDRMVGNLVRLSEDPLKDPLDELEGILKELRKVESSIAKILHGFPLVNALIGSWFFAVLAEAENLVQELYDEFRYDEDFLRRNGRKRWKGDV